MMHKFLCYEIDLHTVVIAASMVGKLFARFCFNLLTFYPNKVYGKLRQQLIKVNRK